MHVVGLNPDFQRILLRFGLQYPEEIFIVGQILLLVVVRKVVRRHLLSGLNSWQNSSGPGLPPHMHPCVE